ncbi:acyl-CoA synthetase (AMP-forming)/AMP-acid ligase II [Rhizobium petrolearium]|uniref:Class I adenylate-forming enzyme family protein n=2 Tax=Neorhizobium TaxID=1525371 RepID=A0ABV0MBE2_9HYPH|nr:class I adenylate-forming enzyme family protein [Neorhizobium petrolearium]MBP1847267.1 acyl-CoA synthetase (AMP-forming)/AMP-acid ligase II [Neorhizobium petrolearium]MCC2614309.1 acyl--CoA ligase [Neorhizobium petrolearium]WGI72412.1 class I adenylate-forming enzyme family protein [Neorhizobium petrolearium]
MNEDISSATRPLPADIECRTPLQLLARNATLYPNKLAIVAESCTGTQVSLTYSALAWHVDKAAETLRGAGLSRGEHLGILLTNASALEYLCLAFGAMRLGGVVVPLNARFADRELVAAIEDMDCVALAYGKEFAARVSAFIPTLAVAPRLRIQVGAGADGDALDWQTLMDAGRADRSGFPEVGEDDLADLLLTSGTTGRSKGVMLTHGNAVATGVAVAGGLSLRPDDIYQSPFPLFTSSGFHFNIMATWWAGATLVIEPGVDVEATLARMTRERTTVYCAVPAVYIFMLERYTAGIHDLSAMRVFDYGGAPMAREVIRKLADTFPHVELRQTYGLTEAGPSGTFLAGCDAIGKLGSIGTAMPLCETTVRKSDLSHAKPGETGEIVMRGPTVMQGYYKRPEETAKSLHDGWLWTGDLATLDEDGYIFYLDRNKDVIIRGGFNISSMEVENAIFEHPDVKEAAVVSIPHDKLGEDLCVFVVGREGAVLDAEELTAFCKVRIADYKVPRRWTFVSELPRNPTGKILKNKLREQARGLNA